MLGEHSNISFSYLTMSVCVCQVEKVVSSLPLCSLSAIKCALAGPYVQSLFAYVLLTQIFLSVCQWNALFCCYFLVPILPTFALDHLYVSHFYDQGGHNFFGSFHFLNFFFLFFSYFRLSNLLLCLPLICYCYFCLSIAILLLPYSHLRI